MCGWILTRITEYLLRRRAFGWWSRVSGTTTRVWENASDFAPVQLRFERGARPWDIAFSSLHLLDSGSTERFPSMVG